MYTVFNWLELDVNNLGTIVPSFNLTVRALDPLIPVLNPCLTLRHPRAGEELPCDPLGFPPALERLRPNHVFQRSCQSPQVYL